jgi:hypothetical protein
MSGFPPHRGVIDTLEQRLRDLLPAHPEILEMDSPFALTGIKEFEFADLQPSLGQVAHALARVQTRPKG